MLCYILFIVLFVCIHAREYGSCCLLWRNNNNNNNTHTRCPEIDQISRKKATYLGIKYEKRQLAPRSSLPLNIKRILACETSRI